MSAFEFESYIRDRLSVPLSDRVDIEVLTGGFTNHIVRVTFEPPISLSLLPGHETSDVAEKPLHTVILKHASPYMAAEPTQPVPVTRQQIEKRALQILNGEDEEFIELSQSVRLRRGSVRIPKLIWHDEEKQVLWIKDLRGMKSLGEVLLLEPSSNPDQPSSEQERETQIEVAADLGQFVMEMHLATKHPPQRLLDDLSSLAPPTTIVGILTNITRSVLGRNGVAVEEVNLFVERVRRGLEEKDEEGACLGMVDFWYNNVLVSSEATQGKFICGLVDWEYFGLSNVANELGMFLAPLHVHILNSSSSGAVRRNIMLFLSTMCHSCASTAGRDWKPSNIFKRRLLLAHGRGMVNGVQYYDAMLDDDSKMKVLRAGLRSLRAAGDSPDAIDLMVLKPQETVGIDVSENGGLGLELRTIWDSFQALRFG